MDAPGVVTWWSPDRREVTLRQVLVQVSIELHRHAGHADVVRELIDGAVGMQDGNSNMPVVPDGWWAGHHARLEKIAVAAGREVSQSPSDSCASEAGIFTVLLCQEQTMEWCAAAQYKSWRAHTLPAKATKWDHRVVSRAAAVPSSPREDRLCS